MRHQRLEIIRHYFHFNFFTCSCCYDEQVLFDKIFTSPVFFARDLSNFSLTSTMPDDEPVSKKGLGMATATKLVSCYFKKPRIRFPIWKEHFCVSRLTFEYIVPCKARSPKPTHPNANSHNFRRTGWIGFWADRNGLYSFRSCCLQFCRCKSTTKYICEDQS